MIVTAIQRGKKIQIYTDKNKIKAIPGFLVAYNNLTLSYVTSKNSQIVIVVDENLKRIRSFSAPTKLFLK